MSAFVYGLRGISVFLGRVVYIGCGFWGLWLCFQFLTDIFVQWAFLVAVLGMLLFPVTAALTPWAMLIMDGDWLPIAVIYGGGIAGTVLVKLGGMED